MTTRLNETEMCATSVTRGKESAVHTEVESAGVLRRAVETFAADLHAPGHPTIAAARRSAVATSGAAWVAKGRPPIEVVARQAVTRVEALAANGLPAQIAPDVAPRETTGQARRAAGIRPASTQARRAIEARLASTTKNKLSAE